HGSPGGGVDHVDVSLRLVGELGNTFQDPFQVRQHGQEDVFTSEVGDGALFHFTVFTIGLDDADVFVGGAVGGGSLDGADVPGRRTPAVELGPGAGRGVPGGAAW